MSACIIRVTLASRARNSPGRMDTESESAKSERGNGGRTSIRFRAEQSLLLAGKRDEFDVGVEFNAELLDSVGDREQRDGTGTIVVATGCL